MKTTNWHNLGSLVRALRERLDHNENYLSRTPTARQMGTQLTYGQTKTPAWVDGEEAAIKAENEWISALLKECP